jgi:ribosomal protein S18 acetylase RimI-like enzyme
MVIDPASGAEASEIAAIRTEGWGSTYAEWVPATVLEPFLDDERVAANIGPDLDDPANVGLVARVDGEIVGFALCYAGEEEEEPFLDALHVLPRARGRGVGTALLRDLAHELDRRGESTLALTVVEQNVRARQLYELLGAVYTSSAPARWAPQHVREAHYRWEDLAPLLSEA